MALRITWHHDAGEKLAFDIKRWADLALYDFSTQQFIAPPAAPAQRTSPLPEGTGTDAGSYTTVLANTPPAAFPDGNYLVTVYDDVRLAAKEPAVLVQLLSVMFGGDDQPAPPAAIAAAALKQLAGKSLTFTVPA